jgi:hypothetical protein
MTVHVPRLPFALDPVIAEAKRRMRQRRLLVTVGLVLVAGAVVGVVLAARGPNPSALPLRTDLPAAVRMDQARMLALFTPPPGARRLAHGQAVFADTGRIFGHIEPGRRSSSRFEYWRVRSSVKTVVFFEVAHPPSGSVCATQSEACLFGFVPNRLLNAPADGFLEWPFPPIEAFIGGRLLRVSVLGLSNRWTAIRVRAVNRPWRRSA